MSLLKRETSSSDPERRSTDVISSRIRALTSPTSSLFFSSSSWRSRTFSRSRFAAVCSSHRSAWVRAIRATIVSRGSRRRGLRTKSCSGAVVTSQLYRSRASRWAAAEAAATSSGCASSRSTRARSAFVSPGSTVQPARYSSRSGAMTWRGAVMIGSPQRR